jgi:hypothetical protein
MNYFKACKIALLADWFDFISDDSVCGNGFVITAYGIKLIALYLFSFIVRALFAVLFPLTALIVMRMKRYSTKD